MKMETTTIRLTEKSLEDKLSINRHSGDNLSVCCVCEAGMTDDNKPIYYTAVQKEQLIQRYNGAISHGYCKLCMNIEMYKIEKA